jgi:hypothetical protein
MHRLPTAVQNSQDEHRHWDHTSILPPGDLGTRVHIGVISHITCKWGSFCFWFFASNWIVSSLARCIRGKMCNTLHLKCCQRNTYQHFKHFFRSREFKKTRKSVWDSIFAYWGYGPFIWQYVKSVFSAFLSTFVKSQGLGFPNSLWLSEIGLFGSLICSKINC